MYFRCIDRFLPPSCTIAHKDEVPSGMRPVTELMGGTCSGGHRNTTLSNHANQENVL